MNSKELKVKIKDLQEELPKAEHKEKARKGVLKAGEFCLITFYEYTDYSDKPVLMDGPPLVFFMQFGTEHPVAMQECYVEWYSPYFADLENCSNSWEKIKAKKISNKEAFKYLQGETK